MATLGRVAGAMGVVSVLVLFGTSFALGYQNQTMTEDIPAITHFFRSVNDTLGWTSSFLTTLGLITCMFWILGLALALLPHERGIPWRTTFLAGAGVLTVVPGQIATWDAATFRSSTIDPQVARYAYDLGGISFANGWMSTGAVGILAGLVMLRARELPQWVAWWGLVAGAGLVVSRGIFREGIAYAPFFAFWVWAAVVSVQLIAGRFVPPAVVP
jgi:hypothetical protein